MALYPLESGVLVRPLPPAAPILGVVGVRIPDPYTHVTWTM